MKTTLFSILLALGVTGSTLHDFKITALDSDKEINLADFKGKKILVVNVASKCGYTPQYKDLQALYQKYQDKLVVIGFPCDQFMGQELDLESSIRQFCTENYQVTFPMTTIVNVKGSNQHPIYQHLTQKEKNGKGDYKVSWNFNKFLIDENGQLIEHFGSSVNPMDEEITNYLN